MKRYQPYYLQGKYKFKIIAKLQYTDIRMVKILKSWQYLVLMGIYSKWTPGVGDGQGGLACCDSWGRKESDTTERLIWSDASEGKESVYLQCRRPGFNPWVGKIPGRRKWQYSCLENSMDRGTRQATKSMGSQRVGYNWVTNTHTQLDL